MFGIGQVGKHDSRSGRPFKIQLVTVSLAGIPYIEGFLVYNSGFLCRRVERDSPASNPADELLISG